MDPAPRAAPPPPEGEPPPHGATSRPSNLRLRRLSRRVLALPRVVLRFAAMALVTLACYPVLEAGALVAGRRRRYAWGSRVFRLWCRLLSRILGLRVEVSGRAPRAPFLLVANHLSYVDVLLLGAAAGCTFVAKREIASWPVIGQLCRAIGTVFIDRGAKRDLVRVAREVEGALAAGKGVVVFPEGTTGDGSALLPFKPALLEVAAAGELPVAWAVIRYRTPAGSPSAAEAVCWTGGQRLVPHALRLLTLPGIRARLHFAAEPIADGDRKRLARRLREAMAARLEAG